MNNKDRQLVLETKMYRTKTFGKQKYCTKCFAKLYDGCLVTGLQRSKQLLCCKAECRVTKTPFELREMIERPSSARRRNTYGLTKFEIKEY